MTPGLLRISLAYLATYLVAAWVGRTLGVYAGVVFFWPAGGVAALWMLSSRGRPSVALDAALLLVGSMALDVALGEDPVVALLLGFAAVVLGLTVRLVSSRVEDLSFWGRLPRRIATPRDLGDLGVAALAGAFASAIPGLAAVLVSAGELTWSAALGWLVRDATSTFIVVAAVLSLLTTLLRAHAKQGWTAILTPAPRRYWAVELGLVCAISVASATILFGSTRALPVAFGMLVASTWIGYRFSPAVGGVYSLALAIVAVLCSAAGRGPFMVIDSLAMRAVTVQLYVLVTVVLVLLLSLGAYERAALTARSTESEAHATSRADLLAAVMDAMTDGLVVVGPTGRPVMANRAAESLAGNPSAPGQLGDPGEHGLFHPDGTMVAHDEIPHMRCLRGELVVPEDILRIDPDTGHHAVLSISATPLERPDKEPLAVVLLHDVTQERAHRRELQAFAGTVAHDLKTPLTGVGSWAEILGDQLDDLEVLGVEVAEPRASLVRIASSAERMEHLISDLLTYSQAQNATLTPVSLPLDGLVDAVAGDLCDATTGTLPLIEHGPLDPVLADLPMVRQLLTNVLGNAVKYVAEGTTPHVVVASKVVGDMVEVRVSDNGIGIPRAERGLIFDSFYRAPESRGYPGTGLGLAICARVVEQHGGRISAREGPDGAGTTIVFTLPADPAPAGDAEDQCLGETTSAEPPPRRTGSATAVS